MSKMWWRKITNTLSLGSITSGVQNLDDGRTRTDDNKFPSQEGRRELQSQVTTDISVGRPFKRKRKEASEWTEPLETIACCVAAGRASMVATLRFSDQWSTWRVSWTRGVSVNKGLVRDLECKGRRRLARATKGKGGVEGHDMTRSLSRHILIPTAIMPTPRGQSRLRIPE